MLLGMGCLAGLFDGVGVAVSFAISVLIVDLFINVIHWIIDSKTADEINQGLKRIQG
jgi:hypothetical protein